MNVGQLKKLIANMPDSWVLLAPASDHSYRKVDAQVEIVECDGGHYSEPDDPDEPQPEHQQALIFS